MTNENNQIVVERLAAYSEHDAQEMNRLLPYLSSSFNKQPIEREWYEQIIASPYHDQLVARDGDKIVGIATLSILFEPAQRHIGYLESFIVDPEVRGRGIGEKIWQEIDAWCREKNVRLEFTSRPSRQDAHRFYQKHGAEIRETTVFRYTPKA